MIAKISLNFLPFLFSCQKNDLSLDTAWCHPEYERIIEKASRTADVEQVQALYREAELILFNEVPILPLSHSEKIFIKNKRVSGFDVSPFRALSFHEVSIKSEPQRGLQ